jgi:nucleotide-binding universal stress UspA family protein
MSARRILVAIDASPGSLIAARAAARLAARLEAELAGLFVEDVRRLRLAESPLAREVDIMTLRPRRPAGAQTQRQLKLQGLRARDALRRIADREGIRWSFRVARGAVSAEIAAAADDAEIVSLGYGGWSTRPQRALGAVASALLERRSACTLLMRRALDVGPPVLVLFDGSEQAERGLSLALRLVAGRTGDLEILLVGSDDTGLRSRLESVAGKVAIGAVIGSLSSTAEPRLRGLLDAARPGALVLPVGGASEHREILHDILERVDCPALLVS